MNIVIILGKIVSEIDFKFIYNRYTEKNNKVIRNIKRGEKNSSKKELKNKISIATCKVELLNKSIVKIYGYDDIADYIYRNLKIYKYILIEGKIDSKKGIEVKKCKNII